MKALLLLVLIALFPTLQEQEREQPDVEVVKFSWVKEKPPSSSMIRGAQNPGGPVTSTVSDGRDLGSRKAEIRTIDKRAAAASAEKPPDSFHLRLELKNNGANAVKGLVWEYRPTAGPEDYQPKRYLCALQVKPKEKNVFEVWTPYLPVKVISAKETKDLLKEGTLVIDQIEYADGSVWKKPGWNYRLPAQSLQKLSEGTCSVF
jgi:hypothetical protein